MVVTGQVVHEDDATLLTAITEQWVYPIMNHKDLDIVHGKLYSYFPLLKEIYYVVTYSADLLC